MLCDISDFLDIKVQEEGETSLKYLWRFIFNDAVSVWGRVRPINGKMKPLQQQAFKKWIMFSCLNVTGVLISERRVKAYYLIHNKYKRKERKQNSRVWSLFTWFNLLYEIRNTRFSLYIKHFFNGYHLQSSAMLVVLAFWRKLHFHRFPEAINKTIIVKNIQNGLQIIAWIFSCSQASKNFSV